MKNTLTHWLFQLLCVLGLHGSAAALPLLDATPPTGPSLAEVLNPDGTLRAGANGSFDARRFRMCTAPDGRPVFRPIGVAGNGDELWADGFGLTNGVGSYVAAVVQSGAITYVGGYFQTAGGVVANRVAKWDGTAWSSLGTGMNGNVLALAVASNGDVYAGGSFSQAGGVVANSVAKWNGTAWSSLGNGVGNGVNSTVSALAVASNGDVYASGYFTRAGGIFANHIAKWDGTAWSSLGTGMGSSANALAVSSNGDVYVGGIFTQAGGVPANSVAKWNGTAWSSLGAGVNSTVYALAVASNGDVYAGGSFSQAGGVVANSVAKWDGTAWSSLGTGVGANMYQRVNALAVASNGEVYAGGYFTQAGGISASNVAKWNGTTWSSLGAGVVGGIVGSNGVKSLAVASNGAVYVGGEFGQAGAVAVNFVAQWNGTAWNRLGTGGNGVAGSINALAVASTGEVYIGGEFTRAGELPANHVAKWDGTAWSSLGTGVGASTYERVYALAVASNGDVYVGGQFTQAGGLPANNVARWNGTAWSSLGTGMNGRVSALAAASNGDVYAGGEFWQAGGVTVNYVAKWNGTAWSSLGGGLYIHRVNALAVASNGDVYAGGAFGLPFNNIAKWNGTAWSSLGTGVNSTVYALAVGSNGDVYAGGQFTQAGGLPANNVAKWNGADWSGLGTGAGSVVNALAVASNGDVYMGTSGSPGGGATATNCVAKWNGADWSSLGTGLNNSVLSLACGPTSQVYLGGSFSGTGGGKVIVCFGIYDPSAPLSTTASRLRTAAFFPNPAHGSATLRLPVGAPRLPLMLVDALGRVVRRYPAPATTDAELDLRGLPAGTYMVRCGKLSQRLVVE